MYSRFIIALCILPSLVFLPLVTSCARKEVQETNPELTLTIDVLAEKELPPLIEYEKNKGILINVHIIDFNGFSETITNKDRLRQFEQRNFLLPQQYRKVLRVFRRSQTGNSLSIVTLYHENGQIYRYLECVNGRASGNFREWYDNGQIKIEAYVTAGSADVDDKSVDTWTFDGLSKAWTPQGKKMGVFSYKKGLLNGASTMCYLSGEVEWYTEYKDGKKSGFERHFRPDGSLIEEISYQDGLREGVSRGYWTTGKLKYQEDFQLDLLQEGIYYPKEGEEALSTVLKGNGVRSLFNDDILVSQYQIQQGKPSGWVKIFSDDGTLSREYSEINGKKDGREVLYYSLEENEKGGPKLAIEWKRGSITGIVETWYPEGAIQSKREMKQNERDGISMGWYPNGDLMLVEDYEKGSLKKGSYHKKGDTVPYSTVENGKGTATIFDGDGRIVEKITYQEGKPVVSD